MKSEPGSANSSGLGVGGVVPFTATDYPGALAAVIFIQGCPWRCGYCHNPHLQPRPDLSGEEWARTLGMLKRRIGLIDAVVFSGGEPTVEPALAQAMHDVRELGFKVGLHTAGVYPARLQSVLSGVDWIGLDIKAPFDVYSRVTGVDGSGRRAQESLEAVLASGVAYEVRTTLHPALLPKSDIERLGNTLAQTGVKNYVLQIYRSQGCDNPLLQGSTVGYPGEGLLARLSAMFPHFSVRRS
jgi:anaerobic ribonucleoside-triphosphate reductase activating protein